MMLFGSTRARDVGCRHAAGILVPVGTDSLFPLGVHHEPDAIDESGRLSRPLQSANGMAWL